MKRGVMVIGSSNADTMLYLERFALPGETVHATGKKVSCGGKGANQAAAASRAGAETVFATALGSDAEGKFIEEQLSKEDMGLIVARKSGETGQAFIEIDGRSENRITVLGGANMKLSPEDVSEMAGSIAGCGILVLQNEIPPETNMAAMKIASENGTAVMYNPAPYRPMPDGILGMADYLLMNRSEFVSLSGTGNLEEGSEALLSAGAGTVIVTLGGDGCFCAGEDAMHVPAPAVEAVDTVGAGDTFAGYLAASLSGGSSLKDSLILAVEAASLACTRRGSLDGIPRIEEVRRRFGIRRTQHNSSAAAGSARTAINHLLLPQIRLDRWIRRPLLCFCQ